MVSFRGNGLITVSAVIDAMISEYNEQKSRFSTALYGYMQVLLCRTKLMGNTEEEMFWDSHIDTSYKCTFAKAKPAEGINVQFDITLENEYNKIVTGVCDYASETNMMFDDMYTFSIFF